MLDDLMQLIQKRTSIRSFTREEISDEKLELIAEAGRTSPTASNKQLRKFTIVKNKDKINQLSQAIGQEIGIADYDFYGATALLLISVPKENQTGCYEVGLAVQNSWLAATALELGMAWTHQINHLSDQPKVRQILNALEIPVEHHCLNVMAIGVPTEKSQPRIQTEEIYLIK